MSEDRDSKFEELRTYNVYLLYLVTLICWQLIVVCTVCTSVQWTRIRRRMWMICKCSCLCRDLSTNQLSAITTPMFAQLKSLHHLKLGWNQISYITEHAFGDLSALKTLWVGSLCLLYLRSTVHFDHDGSNIQIWNEALYATSLSASDTLY